MIDIHCHILNNVDDGSRDMLETLQILEQAEQAGFTDIILTPHYVKDYYENTKQFLIPKYEGLKGVLFYNNILINLYLGNEICMNEEMPKWLEDGNVCTLSNSRYVLFEIPLKHKIKITKNVIINLTKAGYVPIIAHPERCRFIQNDINELRELIDAGALVQCNYGSIMGKHGAKSKSTLIELLNNNMVHFLSTDTHTSDYVYKNFDKISKTFLKYIDEQYYNNLTTNNAKYIINDMEKSFKAELKELEQRNKFLIPQISPKRYNQIENYAFAKVEDNSKIQNNNFYINI